MEHGCRRSSTSHSALGWTLESTSLRNLACNKQNGFRTKVSKQQAENSKPFYFFVRKTTTVISFDTFGFPLRFRKKRTVRRQVGPRRETRVKSIRQIPLSSLDSRQSRHLWSVPSVLSFNAWNKSYKTTWRKIWDLFLYYFLLVVS